MAKMLGVNGSLTNLSIYGNSIMDEGVGVVCEAIQNNKNTKLASLDIGDNGMSQMGAKSVGSMLAVNGSLTKLDARGNRMGSDGEATLQKAAEGRAGFELKL